MDIIIKTPPIMNFGVNTSLKKKNPTKETYTGSYVDIKVAEDGPISFKPE